MKKTTQYIIAIVLFIGIAHAAVEESFGGLAECEKSGYTLEGDTCIFPDGSTCHGSDFYYGTCGKEWKVDYCVEEGKYVWSRQKCCEGLEPYLAIGHYGQARCVNSSLLPEKRAKDDQEYEEMIKNREDEERAKDFEERQRQLVKKRAEYNRNVVLLILFVLLIPIIYWIYKKKVKR